MNRLRTSLTAVTVTGALALGFAPAAFAEEANSVEVAGVDYYYKEALPDILYTSIEDACAGTNWVADPKNTNSRTAVTAADCETPAPPAEGETYYQQAGWSAFYYKTREDACKGDHNDAQTSVPAGSKVIVVEDCETPAPPAEVETYYQQAGWDAFYYKTREDACKGDHLDAQMSVPAGSKVIVVEDCETPAPPAEVETYYQQAGYSAFFYKTREDACKGDISKAQYSVPENSKVIVVDDCEEPGDGSSSAGLLGIILPAALIIGGITWWLNHDGKTYIKDSSRVNQAPTAEEKKASEEMLSKNTDEVKKQAESNKPADGKRGMLAQTGSNTTARIAFAALLLALITGVAYAARRRFNS